MIEVLGKETSLADPLRLFRGLGRSIQWEFSVLPELTSSGYGLMREQEGWSLWPGGEKRRGERWRELLSNPLNSGGQVLHP